MYIHLNQIKHQLNLRKHIPLYRNEIGSILKELRRKHNLTLEEGAEGICSISYLSKIENNMMIPNDKYLDQFKIKYNIKDISFINQNLENLYYELIEGFMTKKINILDLTNHIDYKSKLINYIRIVQNESFFETEKLYLDLITYIKNFSDLEVNLFLYATALILKYQGRLQDAFHCLDLYKNKNNNFLLELLIQKEKLILSMMINNHAYIVLNKDSLIEKLARYDYYEIINEIKYSYLNYLIQFINENELNDLLEKHSRLSLIHKNYLKTRFLYLNARYQEAYKLIIGKERIDKEHYFLAIRILNKLNHKDEIIDLLKHKVTNINKNEDLTLAYLKCKLNKNNIEHLDFIRNQIMKVNDFPDLIDDLNFWYEEGIEYFKKDNFYKEATYLSQMMIRKIRSLATSFK